jgi:hypothetical protein
MITETDSDIAKREPQKGVNGSSGTQARWFAVHELPIPGTADSLRRALRIAPHRLPIRPFPRHPEKCGDVEPDPKLLPREGNPYRTSVTLPMIRRALRGWLTRMSGCA